MKTISSQENSREDITDTLKLFAHMQQVIKINEATLVTGLALLQRRVENRNVSLKEKLQEEIGELEERKSELEQLSQIGDDICLLQVRCGIILIFSHLERNVQ